MKRLTCFRFSGILMIMSLLTPSCIQEQDCTDLSDEYFPNQVGNWWTYDRFDSLAMEQTLLRVEVLRDSVDTDGQTYRMWVFNKSNIHDTLFVRTTADSVLFYRHLDGFPEEVMLKPLSVGRSWIHPILVRDSTWVISKDTFEVNYDVFTDAYHIRRRLFAFNDYLTDDRWFVPNLGLVKLENWHYLFGWISKENWYLKDFGFTK